jgi:hypothetical protein
MLIVCARKYRVILVATAKDGQLILIATAIQTLDATAFKQCHLRPAPRQPRLRLPHLQPPQIRRTLQLSRSQYPQVEEGLCLF